ncbi:hypothetical protein CSC26_3632 [Pseudomonas aeruginosa]|nr:hypothetical protein CSC26_3645 [Pseudomonas aeruginosa]AWF01434.1 hypothetical protein CSC26_3632 [Pseudomonas aeruginosa]
MPSASIFDLDRRRQPEKLLAIASMELLAFLDLVHSLQDQFC